jgi:hypothetical protein
MGLLKEFCAMTRRTIASTGLGFSVILTSFTAFAQQAAGTAGVNAQAQVGGGAQAPATEAPPPPVAVNADANAGANQQGMALPTATNATNAQAPRGNSEHDDVVGHLAVGYMGTNSMAYGVDVNGNSNQLGVPVVGVRYWLDPMLGLDLGAGLLVGGRSSEVTPAGGPTTTASGPKPTAFMLHAGVPLALTSAKHFAFEVIPEANFGLAQMSQDATLDPVTNITKQSGTHLDVGARVGAEIHFGFIGVPQLSLVGTVGLKFNYDSVSTESEAQPAGTGVNKISSSSWTLGTTLNERPWGIFTNNLSVFYYF